jgi:pyrrolidone-carboxylate peptidase
MPVEWGAVERMLEETLQTYAPDIIVSLGHAASYTHLTIEKSYYNSAEGEDAQSFLREGGLITRSGPLTYISNIDTEKLCAYLCAKNIPAVVHDGKEGMSYLCNFAGYIITHHIMGNQRTTPSFVFLHLPPDALPYPSLVLGVKETLLFLIKERDKKIPTHKSE